MSISRLYDKTVTTQRMVSTVGNKKQLTAYLTSLACAIQSTESAVSQSLDGSFYQTYVLVCNIDTDIIVGDRVFFGTKVFIVRGIEAYDYGRNQHLEVTIMEGET